MLGSDIRNVTDKRLRRLAILADEERNKIEYGWQARLARILKVDKSQISVWIKKKNKIPWGQKERIVSLGYALKDWWDEPSKAAPKTAQKRKLSKKERVVGIDQQDMASRILELLSESEWTMKGLAASISKHLAKPLERRLLTYHLSNGHIKLDWHKGIEEYFGSMAQYVFFGIEKKSIVEGFPIETEGISSFAKNICDIAVWLLRENHMLNHRLRIAQERLLVLEALFKECKSPEEIGERRKIWKHLETEITPLFRLSSNPDKT